MADLVVQLQAEVRDLKLTRGAGRKDWMEPETPSASWMHRPGQAVEPLTPKPTPKPRTIFGRTPPTPGNTPVTATSTSNEAQSASVEETTCEQLSASPGQLTEEGEKAEATDAPVEVRTKRPNIIPDRYNGKTPWRTSFSILRPARWRTSE